MSERYIEQKPYVDEYGIFYPINPYVPEGCLSTYKCIITKETFVEAYDKWIRSREISTYGQDDADDWCDD